MEYIQRVYPESAIPLYAIMVTTVGPCLLAHILLRSSVAFNYIIDLSVVDLFAS